MREVVSVREHYEELLAAYYSRMFGDFEAKVAEQQALLGRLGLRAPAGEATAVDLGCGSGFQSIALARLGFRVLAVDFSDRLLVELGERTRGLPVTAIAGDIREIARIARSGVELVVCMGDTLTHLEREEDVGRLFGGVAAVLCRGGRFVLTFRDLSGARQGLDRFLPVCAADDLVMTCFLEYERATVKVHDLVWTRHPDGWRFRTSAYRKLRLGADSVIARLTQTGFSVERHAAPAGMVALVGALGLPPTALG